jgi:hypothetical protein
VIWEGLGTQNICLLLKLIHKLHFPMTSAWAQWVHSRASLVTLKGDIHGEHWEALRSLLPLYQAITTVKISNGTSCSFWLDVWHGDEALADRFPALFSHCTAKGASVSEIISTGIRQALVPRLSTRATCELQEAQDELATFQLLQSPDQRSSSFCKDAHTLDSGAIYHLLKSRGQQPDDRAAFIWQNSAPPRVQLFM